MGYLLSRITALNGSCKNIVDKFSPCETAEEIDFFCSTVMNRRGLDISQYKEKFLLRRIAVRQRANKDISLSGYTELVERSDEELDRFIEVLTVNVSGFFRNPDMFELLKNKIIPHLVEIKEKNGEDLKIWSAGCSTGQEPYSISIITEDYLRSISSQISYSIIATDIDNGALEIAEKGYYSQDKLSDMDKNIIDEHFSKIDGSEEYKISENIRKSVSFIKQDLFNPFDKNNFDLILCRNVMIYFSISLQLKLISTFYDKLASPGYLVLGQVERLLGESSKYFTTVDNRYHIYKKANGE